MACSFQITSSARTPGLPGRTQYVKSRILTPPPSAARLSGASGAVTLGARPDGHIFLLDLLAHMLRLSLPVPALQVMNNPFKLRHHPMTTQPVPTVINNLELLPAGAIQDHLQLLGCGFFQRHIRIQADIPGYPPQEIQGPGMFVGAPDQDTPVIDGTGKIQDFVGINFHLHTQTVTGRTRAKRRVKREHAR